jgi:Flp pilus assembly protein TadB
MSNSDQEQERLRRLREHQLTDRNPHVKQREFYRSSNERERRSARPYTLAQAWAVIPHLYKVPFYALLLGVILLLVITSLWISFWAWVVGGMATLIFVVVGFVVGQALDARDKLRDLSK